MFNCVEKLNKIIAEFKGFVTGEKSSKSTVKSIRTSFSC